MLLERFNILKVVVSKNLQSKTSVILKGIGTSFATIDSSTLLNQVIKPQYGQPGHY